MTTIYRTAPADSPQFGRGSFWTMRRESVRYVAEVEAGTSSLPAVELWQADVLIGDDVREQPLDDLLPMLAQTSVRDALPRLRAALLEKAEKHAAAGCEWVRFTDHGESWNGAMLYLGEKPIDAQLAPIGQD
jgi:hypothetical protein